MKTLMTILLCLPLLAHAQMMFKCKNEAGKTEYTDAPCASMPTKAFKPRESLRVDGQSGARQFSSSPAASSSVMHSKRITPTSGGYWVCDTN